MAARVRVVPWGPAQSAAEHAAGPVLDCEDPGAVGQAARRRGPRAKTVVERLQERLRQRVHPRASEAPSAPPPPPAGALQPRGGTSEPPTGRTRIVYSVPGVAFDGTARL